MVNASKQLIAVFEQKIKDRIARVWGTKKEENKEQALSMAAEAEVGYGE